MKKEDGNELLSIFASILVSNQIDVTTYFEGILAMLIGILNYYLYSRTKNENILHFHTCKIICLRMCNVLSSANM